MKSRVHPKYKTKYHVANWPEYERSLVQRGDVTLWLSTDAIDAWTPRPSGRRGALVHGCYALGHRAVGRHWLLGRLPADDLDMKSRVHPKYKTRYHVGNWPE